MFICNVTKKEWDDNISEILIGSFPLAFLLCICPCLLSWIQLEWGGLGSLLQGSVDKKGHMLI